MKQLITLDLVSTLGGSKLYLVKQDKVVLGFIEKRPNVSGETHPWKAFEAITGQGQVRVNPSVPMKVFYAGKQAAINYLAKQYGN